MTDRPVGRPRTTIDDLPENWREIMQECGQDGGSATEARAMLGIGDSAWSTLLEDSPEFRLAEKTRDTLCEVWWERLGRTGASGKTPINPTVWIFNMKNRFGWRDKPKEDEGEQGQPLNINFEVSDPVSGIKVTKGE